MKILSQASTGINFKMGRIRPPSRAPIFDLRRYLLKRGAWPSLTAPPTCDYSGSAMGSLSQIYLNDTLGICVPAALAHIDGVWTGNAGNLAIYTSPQLIRLYGKIGGYVPGDPSTDNGCDEQTAMNFARRHGMIRRAPKTHRRRHRVAAWIAIDGSDVEMIQLAVWLFENVMFGMELPDEWISPFPNDSGFVWGPAGQPDPNNGHAFNGFGYDKKGVSICTWGMLGTITYPAVKKYTAESAGGELYAMISKDCLARATQKAPTGLDWEQLTSDLIALPDHAAKLHRDQQMEDVTLSMISNLLPD